MKWSHEEWVTWMLSGCVVVAAAAGTGILVAIAIGAMRSALQ